MELISPLRTCFVARASFIQHPRAGKLSMYFVFYYQKFSHLAMELTFVCIYARHVLDAGSIPYIGIELIPLRDNFLIWRVLERG